MITKNQAQDAQKASVGQVVIHIPTGTRLTVLNVEVFDGLYDYLVRGDGGPMCDCGASDCDGSVWVRGFDIEAI